MDLVIKRICIIICACTLLSIFACSKNIIDITADYHSYKNHSTISFADLINMITYQDSMDKTQLRNKSLYLARKEFYLALNGKRNKYEMPVISTNYKTSSDIFILHTNPKIQENTILSYLNKYGFKVTPLDGYSNKYINNYDTVYLIEKHGYNKSILCYNGSYILCTLYE